MFQSCKETAATALRAFSGDEGGATAIEYALIASGVSIVIAVAVFAVGSSVQGMFSSVSSALK
jgi:pilus assembly protein Flp/PilA